MVGNESKPKPKKYHLVPPRIYLNRNYLKILEFTSNRQTRQLLSDYLSTEVSQRATVELFLQEQSEDNKTLYTGDITISNKVVDGKHQKVEFKAIGTAQMEESTAKLNLSSQRGIEFELQHNLAHLTNANVSGFFSMNSNDKFSRDNCRIVAGVGIEQKGSDFILQTKSNLPPPPPPPPPSSADEAKKSAFSFFSFSSSDAKDKKEVNGSGSGINNGSANGGRGGSVGVNAEPELPQNHTPAIVDEQPGIGAKVRVSDDRFTMKMDRYRNRLYLYGGVHPFKAKSTSSSDPILGAHLSLFHSNILNEFMVEYGLNQNRLAKLDMGVSYIPISKTEIELTPPEIAIVGKNLQNIFFNDEENVPSIIFSFYKHISTPRRIIAAVDKNFKLITNYVDVGLEIDLKLPTGNKLFDGDVEEIFDSPNITLAAQWQLNKNHLVKSKIDTKSIGVSWTGMSWWQPRLSFSLSAKYDWNEKMFLPGFWIVVDNTNFIIREKSKQSFRQSVGITSATYVSEEDDDMV